MYNIHFDLNFDDTYDLSIKKGSDTRFEVCGLLRQEMTQQEDVIVQKYMDEAVKQFHIPEGGSHVKV